ncbi:hypothetical protein AAFF_G00025140, partial [Aldrovandia affinis]
MSFLHPFIQHRETSGNMEDDEGEEEDRQESEAVLEREGESQTPGTTAKRDTGSQRELR